MTNDKLLFLDRILPAEFGFIEHSVFVEYWVKANENVTFDTHNKTIQKKGCRRDQHPFALLKLSANKLR